MASWNSLRDQSRKSIVPDDLPLTRNPQELLVRRATVGALRAASLPVRADQAGAHLVVDLPSHEVEHIVMSRARAEGLLLDGLARCHDGRPRTTE
jgi:hypothetical protein